MNSKKIIFYLLAAFIAGNLLLIYIQYNSAKNINTLIEGNEKVLVEFNVSKDLKELERDILSVESKTGNTKYTRDPSYIPELEIKITEVEADLKSLQKISDDDNSVKYIDMLDILVHKKLIISRQIGATSPKTATNHLTALNNAKQLNDSIALVTNIIENSRQELLTAATSSIDKSGEKALNFGTGLIALVLLTGAVLFWFIINTIRNQNQLINQLNISEKKVKESARVKENFLANMSHEIRTPMNAMLGFTNLLQRKNLDSEGKGYVQTIQNSGEKLLTIINDILDLSKIEAGMMRIESSPFSIRGLVHSIEIMFKAKAAEKQLQLSVDVDTSLPDTLEGDATRLTQILVNLIGNALKFTNKGSIFIKITNEGIIDTVIKTGIAVTDTGIGIEKEKLKTIFERFRQAEDSVTRKYGGTGLGLSIVNDLVVLQKGNITVESQPGIGTSFNLIIPYHIAAAQLSILPAAKNNNLTKTNFENVSVLVAEDNEINQSLITHLFKIWQLNFDMANNGKEAVDMLQAKKYDLVLMDIQMPEMDGYTASQKIRGTLQLDTPIIAMTAHALAGEREKCLSYGMNEYISKPIREEELHELIARFVQIKNTGILQKQVVKIEGTAYKYINLQYMKEVSNGNREYEKTVTEQFIEALPGEIKLLQDSFKEKNYAVLKQTAHNMKTTVSVMGLNEEVNTCLDALEYKTLNDFQLQQKIDTVKEACKNALAEAKLFLTAF
jgi:signal transduction histidine kinase/CheY-like chemotaxis protein